MVNRHTPFLLAVLALSSLLLCCSCAPYLLEEDLLQDRLDVATPPLDGTHSLAQSFTCQHPFLYEVELLPAVYAPNSSGSISFALTSANGKIVVSQQTIDAASITANQPLRLVFSAQPDSAGRTYHLEVEGSTGVQIGLWCTSYNSLAGGELAVDGGTPVGDLRLVTRCRYSVATVFQQTLRSWLPRLKLLIPLALLLVVPGLVLGGLFGPRWDNPLLGWSVVIGLSLTVVPVVLLWTSLFGWRWQGQFCLPVYGLLALVAIVGAARARFRGIREVFTHRNGRAAAALAMILLVTLLLRLVQIRNLALPAWVDSPQHVLITQLVTLQGAVPASYEPLLPVRDFYYHYGFHIITAVFAWLAGLTVPDAMLLLGQVVSVLCSLSAYAFGAYLFRRHLPGVAAAILTGLVSYLPAYYVSWGRYTQLTGMALLPVAAICAIEWLCVEKRDGRLLLAAALLSAGLFLTHARVAIFCACLLTAYLLIESICRIRLGARSSLKALWLRAATLLACSLLLCLPWVIRLAHILPSVATSSASRAADASYNAVPTGLLFIRNNKQLFVIAALGVLLGLRRFRREVSIVLLTCVLVGLVVNPAWLRLPGTNLVNNASAVISLFLPLSALGGLAVAELPVQLAGLGSVWPGTLESGQRLLLTRRILLAALTIHSLLSAWGMASIVNPDTVLATQADLHAIQWIQTTLPGDSLFLINTRYWQLDMYVGTDGGYWIQPLTGRRTLLPPLPYVFGSADYVQHVADLARTVAEAQDVDSPEFLELLHREGVTHVYVGAKGGALQPQLFLASSNYRTIYESGAVWIFEVLHQER